MGCNNNDKQVDSAVGPRVILVEEFYTAVPGVVANGPDTQATRAAARATEIDQALQRIEANLTPSP